MKKTRTAIILSLVMATTANAEPSETFKSTTDTTRNADGSYKTDSSVVRTDSKGTTKTSDLKEELEVDSKGAQTLTSDSKNTTDPKGLGNETVTEKQSEVKTDARGSYNGEVTEQSVDSKGTSHESEMTGHTEVNPDGSTKTTITGKNVTDPKGLMNSKSTETKVVIENDGKGNFKDTVTRKVDGKVVKPVTK